MSRNNKVAHWGVVPVAQMNSAGGCVCKLAGSDLIELLRVVRSDVPGVAPVAALDDCAEFVVGVQGCLASTDLVPVVGVDYFKAGRIAAEHSLNDIYASGGVPRWALVTLVLGSGVIGELREALLSGVYVACKNAGVQVIGGHTLIGEETLAGLAVIGTPRGGRVLRKAGGKSGDVLLLSKPLGAGLVGRAICGGALELEALDSALEVMLQSSAEASKAAVEAGAHACTDISGYGFLGHLKEMLSDGLGALLYIDEIPRLDASRGLPETVLQTRWMQNNREYVADTHRLRDAENIPELAALFDPQTNGGLLVAAAEDSVGMLQEAGYVKVGVVTDDGAISFV